MNTHNRYNMETEESRGCSLTGSGSMLQYITSVSNVVFQRIFRGNKCKAKLYLLEIANPIKSWQGFFNHCHDRYDFDLATRKSDTRLQACIYEVHVRQPESVTLYFNNIHKMSIASVGYLNQRAPL